MVLSATIGGAVTSPLVTVVGVSRLDDAGTGVSTRFVVVVTNLVGDLPQPKRPMVNRNNILANMDTII